MDIRLIEPVGPSVLLADADTGSAASFSRMLAGQGCNVAAVVASPDDLPRVAERVVADVVVINAGPLERRFLAALGRVAEPFRRPTLMLSTSPASRDIRSAVAAGANAYVVVGVKSNRIRTGIDLAIANRSTVAALQEELSATQAALEARKLIERAKGIIMKQRGLSEDDAYRLLRGRAMERGKRLIDVARTITEAEEFMA